MFIWLFSLLNMICNNKKKKKTLLFSLKITEKILREQVKHRICITILNISKAQKFFFVELRFSTRMTKKIFDFSERTNSKFNNYI